MGDVPLRLRKTREQLALQGLAKMLREEFPETSPGAKSVAAICSTWTAWNVTQDEIAAIRSLGADGVFDVG